VKIDVTYLNERIELFDGVYNKDRASELRAAVQLYNRTIGPIASINLLRPEARDLSIYSAYCRHNPVEALMTDLRVKASPLNSWVPGGGKGATMMRSVLGALGEMTERLLATLHFSSLFEKLQYGTYVDLTDKGYQALGPDDIFLFTPDQYAMSGFEYAPFDNDSWLGWVEGTDLLTGESVWVPAQLVLMYYKPHQEEQLIGYATTAGLAFQTSRHRAVLHGLYEVIERDALNVRWYSRLAPAKVRVDLRKVLTSHLDVPRPRVRTPHINVEILHLTLDSPIPALAAVGIDRSRKERAFLGGTGASQKPAEALAQALFELGQSQTGFHFEDPFGRNPIHADTDLADVVAFFDAPLYYGHACNLPRTYWFSAGQAEIAWEDVPRLQGTNEPLAFQEMLDWLRLSRFNPIVFDFGDACPPGMAITKVYIPELTQACPPRNPMLGHPRFYQLPFELGLTNRRLSYDDLNSDPIPFA
jgi:ribosomal protein S12 methylthiotransferase accessory factor